MSARNVRLLSIAASGMSACAAVAQTAVVVHDLNWTEVLAGTGIPVSNPNGILEPGEAARVTVSASFTPVGTLVLYQSFPAGGLAPVAGMRRSTFALVASGANGGDWSDITVNHGFLQIGTNPVGPDGSIGLCSFVAPLLVAGSSPNPANPLIDVWEGVWTPSSYMPRQASFQQTPLQSVPPLLFVFTGLDPSGNPLFGNAEAVGTYGVVHIPVIPTPAAAWVLGVPFLVARRKRRFLPT